VDFEELKVVWDSQNDEPLYAMNAKALGAMIRRRIETEHRRTAWSHGREIVINFATGLALFGLGSVLAWGEPAWLATRSWVQVPVSGWHALATFVAGGIWLYCAVYLWMARRRQLRQEESYGTSLHGNLERALAHIDFQIHIARSILWWGLVPSWIAAVLAIAVIFHLQGAPALAYAMMATVMASAFLVTVWCRHRAIRRRYMPRRRELEPLRAKLAEAAP
jgi:hypothetical protein